VREDVPLAVPRLTAEGRPVPRLTGPLTGQLTGPLTERCGPASRPAGWIVDEPRWDAYYAVIFAACLAIVEAGNLTATGRIIATAALAAMVPGTSSSAAR